MILTLTACFGAPGRCHASEVVDLLQACSGGKIDEIAEIVLRNPNVIAESNAGSVPLLARAVMSTNGHGTDESVVYLLARGVDVEIVDEKGRTPTEAALASERFHTAKRVAEHASIRDLVSFARLGRIDLALAAFAREQRDENIVAGVNRYRASGFTDGCGAWDTLVGAMWAVRQAPRERRLVELFRTVARLKESGLDEQLLHEKVVAVAGRHLDDEQRRELALDAASHDRAELLEMVRRIGVKADAEFRKAVSKRLLYPSLTEVLLKSGWVEKRDAENALVSAAECGYFAPYQRLLEAGVNPDTRSGHADESLLIMAVQNYRHHIMEDLLRRKADLSGTDRSGSTALHYAYSLEDETAIAALIKAGANQNSRDRWGKRPIDRRPGPMVPKNR